MRNIDSQVVAAVMEDFTTAPIREPLRGALALLQATVDRPAEIGPDDLVLARAAGLDDVAIEDAANIAFHFHLINRLADAFDFTRPNAEQLPRLARLLDRAGNLFGAKRPAVPLVEGADGRVRPAEVEQGRATMLTIAAATDPALRRAVEAHCARALGGTRPADAVAPEALHDYLDKLARFAYRITDEDVDALRAAGFADDDTIFEITLAGAMGASVVGLEAISAALLPAARHAEPSHAASTMPRAG